MRALGSMRCARSKSKLPVADVRPLIGMGASSANKSELEPLLAVADIGDLIEGATISSDAEHSKPDPDIVRAALVRLELHPAQVIMLGDTPYDIEAATRSGLGTVALRCGGHSDHELSGAIAIYDDPADLLRQFASSPFSRAGSG